MKYNSCRNPQYACIGYGDGQESTISIWHLAPSGGVARPPSPNLHTENLTVSSIQSNGNGDSSRVSQGSESVQQPATHTQPVPSPPGGVVCQPFL